MATLCPGSLEPRSVVSVGQEVLCSVDRMIMQQFQDLLRSLTRSALTFYLWGASLPLVSCLVMGTVGTTGQKVDQGFLCCMTWTSQ